MTISEAIFFDEIVIKPASSTKMQSENLRDKNQRKKKGRTWAEAAKIVSEDGDLHSEIRIHNQNMLIGDMQNVYGCLA